MSSYTQESWVNDGYVVYFPGGEGGFSLRDCPQPEDKARRIVTCVNACRGLDTEILETILMLGETLLDRFELRNRIDAELTGKVDSLLSALKRIEEYPETSQQELGVEAIKAIARVAIERVEGDENESGDK